MAKTSSTVRTTTIRMTDKSKSKTKTKTVQKGNVMTEKERLRAAKAKAKAKEQAKRKAAKNKEAAKRKELRRKARIRMWIRFRQSAMVHWSLTALGSIALLLSFYYFFIRPYSYRWKPCYGYKGYGVCLPVNYKVHGIDVSHHQGKIDWKAVKATDTQDFPIRFAFVKATEGGDYKDKRFDENFTQIAEMGLIRGAYHFYNPNTDPIRQADFFISQVDLRKGDLAPVLDIERKPYDKKLLQADLIRFLNRLEEHYGVKPIIYTSYKYKTRYLDTPDFEVYPFWIAHYYVDTLSYEGSWLFWQHTDYGTVPGINENVDLNVFNGSMNELQKYQIK